MQFARSLQSDKEGVCMSRMVMVVIIVFFVLFVVMLSGCSKSTTGPEEKASITISYTNYSGTTIKECLIKYLVTDGKGNPLPSKRVDFEIIEGDAILSKNSDLTYTDGGVSTQITKKTLTTATVKASVYGYDASVTASITFK